MGALQDDPNEFGDESDSPSAKVDITAENFIREMMKKVTAKLNDDERADMESLLDNNRDVFSLTDYDLGRTNLVKHRIG